MVHNYRINHNNVILRPLAEEDLESLRNWRNNPRNTIYLSKLPYITIEMQKEWFQKYLRNKDELFFAIEENQELNRMVGSLSLYEFYNDTCFFGKIIVGDESAHGKKIGLNATIAATKVALELLRQKKVYLYVYAENLAALKIYKEAGFIIINEHKGANGSKEYTMVKEQEIDCYA